VILKSIVSSPRFIHNIVDVILNLSALCFAKKEELNVGKLWDIPLYALKQILKVTESCIFVCINFVHRRHRLSGYCLFLRMPINS